MPGAAIEFEFKGNLAQLRRDLNEAARMAKQSAGEVTRTTERSSFTDLFRRTPERRAERALSGLGTSLATGDIATGIAAFSEKLSGLGLAAGIGVGITVGLFEKLREQIKAASEARENLGKELAKPISTIGGLGPEGITSEIEKLTKAGEENSEKQKTFGMRLGKYLAGATTGALGAQAKADKDLAEDYQKGLVERLRLRADAELKIANIKLQAVTTSEKDAALAKIAADAEEKRSKLKLERKDDPNLARSLEAVNVEEKAARAEVEKKFKAKKEEADLEAYIISLKDKGLAKEQQQTEEVRARVQLLKDQLSGAKTEDKLDIQNKLTPLQQQLAAVPWEQKTFPEKMEAIKAAQAKQASAKEDWFKNRAKAVSDYYQRRDEATKLYEQARYGHTLGGAGATDSTRANPTTVSDEIGTQIYQAIDAIRQWMTQNVAVA